MNSTDIANGVQHSGGVHLLAEVFGTWIYHIFNLSAPAGGTPETAITVFGSVLVLGGGAMLLMILMYTAFAGLIKTGQEGVLFGRQWDAPWIMLRTAAAAILLVPVTIGGASGITLGQAAVIKLAMAASSVTDHIWGEVGAAVITGHLDGHLKTIDQVNPDLASFEATSVNSFRKIIEGGRCTETHVILDGVADIVPDADPSVMIPGVIAEEKKCGVKPFPFDPQTVTVTPSSSDLSYDKPDLLNFETPQIDTSHYVSAMNGNIQQAIEKSDMAAWDEGLAIGKAQWGDQRLWTTRRITATEQRYAAEEGSKLRDYVARQTATAQQAIAKYAGQQWAETAQNNGGWIDAAADYQSIVVASDAASNAIATLSSSINKTTGDGPPQQDCSGLIHEIGCLAHDMTHPREAPATFMSGLETRLGLTSLVPSHADPMAIIESVGNKFSAASVYVTGIGLIPGLSTLGKIGLWLGGIGIILAVIIPAIPTVYFLTGVFRWLIYVIEAYLVQPFWDAAWAAPEGKQHMSTLAANGYNALLCLALYPVLLIGGFLAAITMEGVALQVVTNWVFSSMGKLVEGTGSSLLAGGEGVATGTAVGHGVSAVLTLPAILPDLIGWVLVWIGVSWIVLSMIFNMIHTLPNNLLNWLSVHEPGVSVFGKGEGGQAHSFVWAQFQKGSHGVGNWMAGRKGGGRGKSTLKDQVKQ